MSNRAVRSGKKCYRKTFTYFIPAPPHRRSGYREREFDKIMQGILSLGFEIESIHTEGETTGMFVLAMLKTHSKKTFDQDINLDIQEQFKLSHTHSSPDIILEEEEDA